MQQAIKIILRYYKHLIHLEKFRRHLKEACLRKFELRPKMDPLVLNTFRKDPLDRHQTIYRILKLYKRQ